MKSTKSPTPEPGIPAQRFRSLQAMTLGAALVVTTGCLKQNDAAHASSTLKPAAQLMDTTPIGELDVEPTNEQSAVFVLEGKPFCFSGTNNYYLTYKSRRMVDDVFATAQKMNLKVIRSWGFVDRGALDGSMPNMNKGDGTQDGVYFQYWDVEAGRPAYNDGPDGLEMLDYVLHKARESNVRMLLALTNSWREFGGMDQYLVWYGLDKHHLFFTDERVKQAYKDWVTHLIGRVNSIDGTPYREDPAIFAWELANEPRTTNANTFDSPDGWDETTITKWATEMAAHIKSLDPHHMVAVGDEGFLNGGGKHWTYKAPHGVDNEALMRIPDIDFGTYHMYPDHWGCGSRWGHDWIEDHIQVARRVGKPTLLEEYGRVVKRDDKGKIYWGNDNRMLSYRNWNELLLKRGGNGSLYWMLSGSDDTHGDYPDYDGFGTYLRDEASKLLADYAAKMSSEAQACKLAAPITGKPSPFVSAQRLGAPSPDSAAAWFIQPPSSNPNAPAPQASPGEASSSQG